MGRLWSLTVYLLVLYSLVLLVECYRELNCDGPFSMVTVEACCTVQERQSYVFQGQERCLSCLLGKQSKFIVDVLATSFLVGGGGGASNLN